MKKRLKKKIAKLFMNTSALVTDDKSTIMCSDKVLERMKKSIDPVPQKEVPSGALGALYGMRVVKTNRWQMWLPFVTKDWKKKV